MTKINLKEAVEKILVKYPTARKDDTFLMRKIAEQMGYSKQSAEMAVGIMNIIKPDYIKRRRRELQQTDKALREPKTYVKRQIQAGIIKAEKRKTKFKVRRLGVRG